MIRLKEERNFKETPKFVKLIEATHGVRGGKVSNIKEIIEEVFDVSVERGLSDEEFSLLLRLFCNGSLNMSDRLKLLQNLVPEKNAPEAAVRQFMAWFLTNFNKHDRFTMSASPHILQWITGLLDYHLVNSKDIDNFYHMFYKMLKTQSLIPHVAKLLCKLTKPDDVTSMTVRVIYNYFYQCNNKHLLAVLNVFKGYKPHLMPDDIKKVDVIKVLGSISNKMDSIMKVRAIHKRAPRLPIKGLGVSDVPTRNFSYFNVGFNEHSSLIPLPMYNLEGMDKLGACYPNSVGEAYRKFSRVPIPINIMSLLHSDIGFFMILYQGIEVQMRFQQCLLQTLQNVIYKEHDTSDGDVEILFRRVYCLQSFLQQGVPSVSIFLSGYLLSWDGLDHRYIILRLIEWATFHSFRELASNILRPLHALFVTYNTNMKKEIIQTLIKLIRNMFADVSRTQRGIPFHFTKRGPKWTRQPETTLQSLVSWTQHLITLGLSIEQDSSVLLMEAIQFYEMINSFEATSHLEMFTVVTEGVVLLSLLSQSPNTVIRICHLILRYHKDLLPRLRVEHPHFYERCKSKIKLTSKYAQQIIYFLQNGQVVPPRKGSTSIAGESRIAEESAIESLPLGVEPFYLMSHPCFVSTYLIFESRKNTLNLSHQVDRQTSVEFASVHLREIDEFINYFSPRTPEVARSNITS